jgi:phospholipase C
MQSLRKALLFLFLAITGPALAASPPEHRPELDRIGHIIVLFLENRSFDHRYGLFPGAEGIQDSGFAPSRSVPKAFSSQRCRPSSITWRGWRD